MLENVCKYVFSFSFGCGILSLNNVIQAKNLSFEEREKLTYFSPVKGFCAGALWGGIFGPFAMLNYLYYSEEIAKNKVKYSEK